MRMTHNEVADAAGISIACWYRLVKNPAKITVQQLIGLANGLNVPVKHFFSFGKADMVGVREDYIMLSDYQNCYYDSDAVHRRIGEGTATSWRKAADAVGMHWTNVSSSLLAVSRTPVTRLLTLCEAFDFNLFEFLIDPNKSQKKQERRTEIREDDAFREEIAAMNGKIDDLSKSLEDLTGKYKALLERHNRLEETFREFLGTDTRIGMAADDGQ